MFVYRALFEAFSCGITEINAPDIRIEMRTLLRPTQEGPNNGFELQFQVSWVFFMFANTNLCAYSVYACNKTN